MNSIPQLWLPILLTAVAIFVASSLIHMVFKWHNSDYRNLPNEDEVLAAIRAGAPGPGEYMLPHCMDMKQSRDETMQKKFRDGPVGLLTLRRNGPPAMGSALALWFVFILLVTMVTAVLAVQVVGLHGDPRRAGHLIGISSLLAYVGGSIQSAIWMGKPWPSVAKDVLDGVIYATIGALTFIWLWPA